MLIEFSSAPTFVDIARQRAEEWPERIAYTFLSDGETQAQHITYADLDQQARAIGTMLQAEGKPGDRAILLYPPGLDYISAFLGCLYAGIIAVPAYTLTFGQLERQNHAIAKRFYAVLEDAQPTIGLTTPTMFRRIRALIPDNPALRSLKWFTREHSPVERARDWVEPAIKSESVAFFQYTSGSTSTPRGVMLAHANLLHNSSWIKRSFGHTEESIGVSWLPPYHDMGLIGGILQPLYAGFPVVLMSPVSFLQRPTRWLEAITRYHATGSGGPDFAYQLCIRKITEEQKASLDLRSWRVAFTGAEPIRAQTLERFAQTFASCGFRREALHPCYGLAEATLLVTGSRPDRPPVIQSFEVGALAKDRAVPIKDQFQARTHISVGCGENPPEQSLCIVHPQTLTLCQDGQVGEIWVAGPHIAQGYWQRERETRDTFDARLTDVPDKRFLRTGDLGFLLGQELFVTGRLKDLIIVRGQNHYPQDIELTVEQSYPLFRAHATAAFTVEDEERGEEQLVIVQELERHTPKESLQEAADAIRKAVADKHSLQARSIVLVRAGTIPRTSSGKIQHHACRSLFQTGNLEALYASTLADPLQEQSSSATAFPPQDMSALEASEQEEQLRQHIISLLGELMHTDPASLDETQYIDALGLDSLMMIELQHTLEARWGCALPLASLWENLQIKQLVNEVLSELRQREEDAISTGRAQEPVSEILEQPVPLSYGQQALYFLHQLAPSSSAYHIGVPIHIAAEIDVLALQRAFTRLIEHHSALRTTFHLQDRRPVQQIHRQANLFFQYEAIADSGQLDHRLRTEMVRPFDLAVGPLRRALPVSSLWKMHSGLSHGGVN